MPHLQKALDSDWETFRVSATGARALAVWASHDARYRKFRDLGELRRFFEQRHDTDDDDARCDGSDDPVRSIRLHLLLL